MFGFKLIRRIFQILLGLWLLFAMGLGFGSAWLQRHPDSGLAAVGGFASVDPGAGLLTQAGQFANGMTKTREMVEMERREKVQAEADRLVARQADEMRRFNSGTNESDDGY